MKCRGEGVYSVWINSKDGAWACEKHVGRVALILLVNRTQRERRAYKAVQVALCAVHDAPCQVGDLKAKVLSSDRSKTL